MSKELFEKIGRDTVRMSVLTTPNDGNGLGHVFGGVIISLMERAAYVAASRHSGHTCVARGMGDVEFAHAVEIGAVLHVVAEVLSTHQTSVLVQVDAYAEQIQSAEIVHTNSCVATLVALDGTGKPLSIPTAHPKSAAQRKRSLKGRQIQAILDRSRKEIAAESRRIEDLDDESVVSELGT
jgi:acyl-CoA hydrolase